MLPMGGTRGASPRAPTRGALLWAPPRSPACLRPTAVRPNLPPRYPGTRAGLVRPQAVFCASQSASLKLCGLTLLGRPDRYGEHRLAERRAPPPFKPPEHWDEILVED